MSRMSDVQETGYCRVPNRSGEMGAGPGGVAYAYWDSRYTLGAQLNVGALRSELVTGEDHNNIFTQSLTLPYIDELGNGHPDIAVTHTFCCQERSKEFHPGKRVKLPSHHTITTACYNLSSRAPVVSLSLFDDGINLPVPEVTFGLSIDNHYNEGLFQTANRVAKRNGDLSFRGFVSFRQDGSAHYICDGKNGPVFLRADKDALMHDFGFSEVDMSVSWDRDSLPRANATLVTQTSPLDRPAFGSKIVFGTWQKGKLTPKEMHDLAIYPDKLKGLDPLMGGYYQLVAMGMARHC